MEEVFIYCSWVITAIGLMLFLSFVWLNRDPTPGHFIDDDITICGSPNCIRCQGLTHVQRLKQRCEDFFLTLSNTDALGTKSQMLSLVTESMKHKNDIIFSVYKESGYELQEGVIDTLPHIWMLPGLDRHTFWSGDMHKNLNEVVCILEKPGNIENIFNEFRRIDHRKGWKSNSIPSGKWKVYHLYDQGLRVNKNSDQCPFTTHLLSGLSSFMCGHVYGNAMFSLLEPGSSIEPHTGPCNYRLRCHLPLVAPPGYRIRVGMDTSSWGKKKLMIFDDSFVHEVWDEGREGINDRQENGRAVLIFDIWHPHVTHSEQAAIRYIYD